MAWHGMAMGMGLYHPIPMPPRPRPPSPVRSPDIKRARRSLSAGASSSSSFFFSHQPTHYPTEVYTRSNSSTSTLSQPNQTTTPKPLAKPNRVFSFDFFNFIPNGLASAGKREGFGAAKLFWCILLFSLIFLHFFFCYFFSPFLHKVRHRLEMFSPNGKDGVFTTFYCSIGYGNNYVLFSSSTTFFFLPSVDLIV
ncbi:hypothetical protein V8C44DRAFT_56082 [Trichoderma aethiopicum]